MTTKDMHNVITPAVALNAAAITSSTTTAGNIIDTQGFESLEFLLTIGTRTDGTYTPLIEDGADSGLSDAAAVADGYLLGTEAGAALTASNTMSRIGYIGGKRYVRLSVVSSGVTSGVAAAAAVAIKGNPHLAKTA